MTIDRGTVQHIARLAELAVSDAEAHALAGQLERIVAFVEQLGELDLGDGPAGAVVVGPERTALREDVVAPIPMARGPEAMAPAMQDGLFLVPRLGGMAAE
jgi:aspartyl-tRNA(Asn)/glutamyl-tRNA(Gln) amidotransferase subunit C